MKFSIIIPVYNRPEEVNELLESITKQEGNSDIEVLIIEDGSTIPCDTIVDSYKNKLSISYYLKYNSGPGDSRNFGMKQANGDYFLLFDSDCILPPNYLSEVSTALKNNYTNCFGGPDRALPTFSNVQKAINFAMTSFIATGGIRGNSEKLDRFQPRSFNMGLSRKAFETSGGFGTIHPGEDPDLTLRLWRLGFESMLFPSAFVYHKRRIDWEKFTTQVTKFGKARPILLNRYPEYRNFTYFLPALFCIGFIFGIGLLIFTQDIILKIYFSYFLMVFLIATIQHKNATIGYLSVIAVWKQFWGYGIGFMESYFKIVLLKKNPEVVFPELFFKL
jgi:glycosyltransferase involved in cell wall biosynthesis